MKRKLSAAALLMVAICCAFLCASCSKKDPAVVEIHGRVTYLGKPVSPGTISFSPQNVQMGATQRPATAVLDANGTYRIKAFRDRYGMPPGEYAVSVLSYNGSMLDSTVEYLVPQKFANSSTSGLLAKVPEDYSGVLELNFDIN